MLIMASGPIFSSGRHSSKPTVPRQPVLIARSGSWSCEYEVLIFTDLMKFSGSFFPERPCVKQTEIAASLLVIGRPEPRVFQP
jgi:hypothetical protein